MEFFSRFLDHLADKLVSLRRLLRKGVPWDFTEECKQAVDLVKNCLMKSPVLKIPDRVHRFVLDFNNYFISSKSSSFIAYAGKQF